MARLDLNVCFPLQRLHELAAEGVIGSVANFRYTVSGAALWRLRAICRASSDEFLQFLGRNSIVLDRQINPPN